jgi:hypothetical protein
MYKALGRALIYRGEDKPPAQRQLAPGGLGAMFGSADLLGEMARHVEWGDLPALAAMPRDHRVW